MARFVDDIAREILADWKNISPAAKPYLSAMFCLETLDDAYFHDGGDSIVLYFLSNASTWRGETARRVKAELKQMLKEYQNG